MKIERLEHPRPFGHPLSRLAVTRTESWIARHYPRPSSLDGIREVASEVAFDGTMRERVCATFLLENTKLFGDGAERRVQMLAHRDALVVITGQQPGLFGGPLFTLEKVAGAVQLSRRLARELHRPVVPVFWNQSEDHDLEETNRLELPKADGVHRLRAPIEDLGRCLGLIPLDEGVVAFAEEILRQLQLDSTLEAAVLRPRSGENFAAWTSRIVAHVFADTDLLIAEPFWFRSLVTPVIRRAVTDPQTLHEAFMGDTQSLVSHGMEPQIQPAEASMLFWVDDDGVRRRIRSGAKWTIEGQGEYSTSELLGRLDSRPAGFSTNVQLRPIVQQMILPVVAQIGGPAEVAYFAQFPSLFRAFDQPLPVILQRPASTVLGPKDAELRVRLGLHGAKLLDDPQQWPVSADTVLPPAFGRARELNETAREGLAAAAGNEPLQRAVDGWWQRTRQSLEKLEETFRKDREREAGVDQGRRGRLSDWVHPKGKPQDRMISILSLLTRARLPAIRRWLETLDPFDSRHVVCTLEQEDQTDG